MHLSFDVFSLCIIVSKGNEIIDLTSNGPDILQNTLILMNTEKRDFVLC